MKNIKKKRFFSIPRKLALLSLAIVFLSLGSFAIYSLNEFKNDKLKYVYLTTNIFTESVGQALEGVLKNYVRMSYTSAEHFQQLAEAKVSPLSSKFEFTKQTLERAYNNNPDLLATFAFRLDPLHATNSEEEFKPQWVLWHHWNNSQLVEELNLNTEKLQYLVEPFAQSVSTTNTNDYRLRVLSYPTNLLAVFHKKDLVSVVTLFRPEAFARKLSQIPGAETLLVDGEGNLIAASSQSFTQATHLTQLADKSPMKSSSTSYELKDETFLGAFYKISSDLTLYSQVSMSQATADLRSIVTNLVLFAIAFGALAIVFNMWFISGLSKGLNAIQNYIQEIAAGRYDQKVVVQSNDELSAIADNFNRLTDLLSKRDAELALETEKANKDPLTGLWNHRHFKEKLETNFQLSRRHKRPLCLAMIDMDHFKMVNGTYGHPVGDAVLKSLSNFLTERLRSTDIVCRYGGEEFAILLPETDLEGAMTIVERVREEFSKIVHNQDSKGQSFQKTLCIGVASLHDDEASSKEDLLSQADQYLYQSKENGRNQCRSKFNAAAVLKKIA